MVQYIWRLPRNFLILLINLYQATLSPDHGPLRHLHPHGFCRHEPTCSEFGKKMLERRGAIVGSLLTAKRILRCNPWTTPDPEKFRSLLPR